jgi:RNA polymerase sigma factor (TIGR02999 family)
MSDITELLAAQGGPDLAAVFDRLYADLRRIAVARVADLGPGVTLNPTSLVHEAFLKLIGAERLTLENRKHFFACAAKAMRQILIDRGRIAGAEKRGAGLERITLERCEAEAEPPALFDLDRALNDLDQIDPALRELVELRYFAGLSMPQIAELQGVSLRTAGRDWERARALLRVRLDPDGR